MKTDTVIGDYPPGDIVKIKDFLLILFNGKS